jgi:hypothetical protein
MYCNEPLLINQGYPLKYVDILLAVKLLPMLLNIVTKRSKGVQWTDYKVKGDGPKISGEMFARGEQFYSGGAPDKIISRKELYDSGLSSKSFNQFGEVVVVKDCRTILHDYTEHLVRKTKLEKHLTSARDVVVDSMQDYNKILSKVMQVRGYNSNSLVYERWKEAHKLKGTKYFDEKSGKWRKHKGLLTVQVNSSISWVDNKKEYSIYIEKLSIAKCFYKEHSIEISAKKNTPSTTFLEQISEKGNTEIVPITKFKSKMAKYIHLPNIQFYFDCESIKTLKEEIAKAISATESKDYVV